MSSLSAVLNSALKSMTASQLALSIASNNIANAGDPNFTRERLLTRPADGDTAVYGVGTGVDILGIGAVRDALVESRVRQETSAKAGADTLANGLANTEVIFNDESGTGLLQNLTNFFNSFQTLAQDPASINFREQLKINARALIDALHGRNRDLTTVKTTADKAITGELAEINRLAGEIADVTKQIKIEEVVHPANDLRDRRTALVKELSTHIEVHELDSSDYQLTTKDNHLLVMNYTAQPFTSADLSTSVGPGSLKAQLDLRDTYVPKYTAALDQLAYELAQQVNSIHSSAYDLTGATGVNFFAPLASAAGAAGTIDLSAEVAGDSRKIAASSLATGNDNGAATQIGNLLHSPVFSGGSITDQYGSLVFAVGADANSAKSSVGEHQALLTQLQNRRQSISGVSIDEETVQILQFQRSFQASARLIQTVDQMLQTVLSIGS